MVIDNIQGKRGLLGVDLVAKGIPDGHTLLFTSGSTLTVIPHLFSQFLYRHESLTPITQVARTPFVLVVHPSTMGTVREVAERHLNYASGGVGTISHLMGELFNSASGAQWVHVPYKGIGPALVGLLSERSGAFFYTATATWPHVRSGKLRALAVTGNARMPQLPVVPTFEELGISVYLQEWYGLFAPAGTPPEVSSRYYHEVSTILRTQAVRETINSSLLFSDDVPPTVLANVIRNESAILGNIIRSRGIRAE